MTRRNRHPFEGDLTRAKAGLRLWTGYGSAYSPAHRRRIPLDTLAIVARVPSVEVANAYIRRTMHRHKGSVKLLTGTGFENAVFIEQTNAWWMLTGEG